VLIVFRDQVRTSKAKTQFRGLEAENTTRKKY